MVASLAKNGCKALIAACNVISTAKEDFEYLKVLKANGITRYRMNYFRYDLKKPLLPQVRDFTARLAEIAAMNKELGMQALYQVHAGAKYAGSLGWDAAMMFEKVAPAHAAVAFDLRHIRSGSGLSFDTAVALLKDHLGSVYVKDARWMGDRTRQLKNVPLDTGIVDRKTFERVIRGQKPMPISLHMEWGKASVYPAKDVMEAVANIARDVKVLKGWL
jgi:sugar phosphate isomerase/epimerase